MAEGADGTHRRRQLGDVEEALTRLTRIINGRAADKIRMQRSGIPLTRPLMSMMRALHEHGPMRILELGALNHMDKGYVSRAWRSLEAFGFVEVIEAGQSRSTVIGLTGAGRNAYLEWRKVNADIVAETFAEWDDADLGELKDLLERVVKSSARLRP